jgi:cytochrome c peroxidase
MRTARSALARCAALLALLLAAGGAAAQLLDFTEAEKRALLRHGPWPAPWAPDPSNRISGAPQAVALGEKLFFEPRLSAGGKVLCATCHAPFRGWQDARGRAMGHSEVERNTPSVLNTRYNRWHGWDGAGDSLWAQSIRPIVDTREMGGSPAATAALVRGDPDYACRYEKALGTPPPADDEALLAGIGKALAAYQETLVTGRTPFDDFRDALAAGKLQEAARYPVAAQRGARIFVGKGNCNLCHLGPAFSNGEFHDVGVPFFNPDRSVDHGRHGGIRRLQASPFNLLGAYNDDRTGAAAVKSRHVALDHRNFGEFKVPMLRNVALTAPYMHNGSLATLADVVRHYSELNMDRLHADGESLLRPLRLTKEESADLVAFLESLTERASALPEKKPVEPCRR